MPSRIQTNRRPEDEFLPAQHAVPFGQQAKARRQLLGLVARLPSTPYKQALWGTLERDAGIHTLPALRLSIAAEQGNAGRVRTGLASASEAEYHRAENLTRLDAIQLVEKWMALHGTTFAPRQQPKQ